MTIIPSQQQHRHHSSNDDSRISRSAAASREKNNGGSSEVLIYEAVVELAEDDNDDMFKVRIELPMSAADMRTLHEDDEDDPDAAAQASNMVVFDVVDRCRCEVAKSNWVCVYCRERPAVAVVGANVQTRRPGGSQPPKVIDEHLRPFCDNPTCQGRACHGSQRAEKKAPKRTQKLYGDKAEYVYACNNCGKQESEKDGPKLLRCSRCKTALYCSSECQRAAWSKHRRECVSSLKTKKK